MSCIKARLTLVMLLEMFFEYYHLRMLVEKLTFAMLLETFLETLMCFLSPHSSKIYEEEEIQFPRYNP